MSTYYIALTLLDPKDKINIIKSLRENYTNIWAHTGFGGRMAALNKKVGALLFLETTVYYTTSRKILSNIKKLPYALFSAVVIDRDNYSSMNKAFLSGHNIAWANLPEKDLDLGEATGTSLTEKLKEEKVKIPKKKAKKNPAKKKPAQKKPVRAAIKKPAPKDYVIEEEEEEEDYEE